MNNETIEIKKENVVNTYLAGDNKVKKMLRTMFPDVEFESGTQADTRPITDRVKTFEDACRELGDKHPFVIQYREIYDNFLDGAAPSNCCDIVAYLKLRIICTALNEGLEPKLTEDEIRWYPCFFLWTSEELDKKDEEWKQDKHLISTDDFHTGYAGFAFANSNNAPSFTIASFVSRPCLKSEALADYCGKQFINIWADFNLIRR